MSHGLRKTTRVTKMTERFENNANGTAENADAKAPLSSYLRRDDHSAPSEGWTIFSSDDQTEQSRTPNLSVLKQIKNFLNAKTDESNVSFDSNVQNFRVDYPYYASESEQTSPYDDGRASHSATSDVESFDGEKPLVAVANSGKRRADETDELTRDKSHALPREHYESKDAADAPTSKQECVFDNVLAPEAEKRDSLSDSASAHENEYDVAFPSVVPQETSNANVPQPPQLSTPCRIDVAEILGSNFPRRWEPSLCGRIEEENETLETPPEEHPVSTPSFPLERVPNKVGTPPEDRESMTLAIVCPTRFNTSRQRDSKNKLSIFHRFVDLATARQQTRAKADENLQNKKIDDNVRDDSHEICICAPCESSNSVEVVVAPCYVGANLTF